MPSFYDTIRCPCPAVLRSQTFCSFTNDLITIDFTVGDFDNKTLQENYPELDLDTQQFYIYKPSELFKKSVDSIITKQSNARNNLQCSYELFDECYTSEGVVDGCFNTSDSFACKYDTGKVKDGLFDSSYTTPFSLYNSKMQLKYESPQPQTNGTFRHIFHVGDNPGTYCINATTYEIFDKPDIAFWDQTPLTKKNPDLSLPNHDALSWIGIATISLIVFGALNLLYDDKFIVTLLIILCLSYDVFLITILCSNKDDRNLSSLFGVIFGSITIPFGSLGFLYAAYIKEESFVVFFPFLFTKLYYFIKQFSFSLSGKWSPYYEMGSVMNDLVFQKYNIQVLFYSTLVLNLIAWGISVCFAFIYCSPDLRKKALFGVSLAALYFITCLLIEVSYVTRKSEFLDVFYKDPLVIIYSRLDEFLIIAYICGNILWKMFGEHYQFFKKHFITFHE